MNAAAAHYHVPREPGPVRAAALALAVHAALFAFLWIGVRWQSETPVTLEAEIWSPMPQIAAPPPAPEPEPVVKEQLKPVQPVEKPDIALEQEKKRKEQAQREEEERLEKLQRLAEEKEAQKKKREQEEKDRKLREDTMKRLMAQAGVPANGDASKTAGMRGSADYAAQIATKIRLNTIFPPPPSLAGNPAVEFAIELLPDGSLKRPPKLVQPSGVAGFDEAVQRAIVNSQPFPKDKSGKVPSYVINVIQHPLD